MTREPKRFAHIEQRLSWYIEIPATISDPQEALDYIDANGLWSEAFRFDAKCYAIEDTFFNDKGEQRCFRVVFSEQEETP